MSASKLTQGRRGRVPGRPWDSAAARRIGPPPGDSPGSGWRHHRSAAEGQSAIHCATRTAGTPGHLHVVLRFDDNPAPGAATGRYRTLNPYQHHNGREQHEEEDLRRASQCGTLLGGFPDGRCRNGSKQDPRVDVRSEVSQEDQCDHGLGRVNVGYGVRAEGAGRPGLDGVLPRERYILVGVRHQPARCQRNGRLQSERMRLEGVCILRSVVRRWWLVSDLDSKVL